MSAVVAIMWLSLRARIPNISLSVFVYNYQSSRNGKSGVSRSPFVQHWPVFFSLHSTLCWVGSREERWGPWQCETLLRALTAWENRNNYRGFPALLSSDTLISSNKYRSNSPERKARLVVLVLPLNYNKLLQMSLIVVLVGTTKMFVCFRKDFLMGDSIWWQVLLILIGDLLKKFILPNQIRS